MQEDQFDPTQPLPDDFLAIPHRVYRDDPYWLGESAELLRARFSPANGFFHHGRAWIGTANGCARLAGFIHPLQQIDGRPVAYFGFWETLESGAGHQGLFAALEAWASSANAAAIYGPIDFNTYGANRLRLNDFDQPCFPGEPYNPHYYPHLLQQMGYELAVRYQTRLHPDTVVLAREMKERRQRQQAQLDGQFILQPLTPEFWLEHLDELYPLVDIIFRQNFAYTPVDRYQFELACGEAFAKRFCPRASVLATTREGDIAGFLLCFPDYGPLMRQCLASPVATEELRYTRHFDQLRSPRLALAKTGGVHPAHRQTGLFNAIGLELVENVSHHYDRIAGALMREGNPSLRFGQICPLQRDYGLFRKLLRN